MKPKEQTKAINGEFNNNQLKAAGIFKDLVNERKSIMNKLYKNGDYNNLKFEYVGNTKSISFYKYVDSKELFNKIEKNLINYNDALEKQKLFMKELNNAKIGGKNDEQIKIINNIENFYKSREEVFNFLKTILN